MCRGWHQKGGVALGRDGEGMRLRTLVYILDRGSCKPGDIHLGGSINREDRDMNHRNKRAQVRVSNNLCN